MGRAEPSWLRTALGIDALPAEEETVALAGAEFLMKRGILRAAEQASSTQTQTSDSFGFKWEKRDTFDSPSSLARMKEWLLERYGDVAGADWWGEYDDRPLVIDAGCGAGMSALELFGDKLKSLRYLGVDISAAVDVAADRFAERGYPAAFLQGDITRLPLPPESVDVVFSEGVLHHTDSTEGALKALSRFLKPGGRFLFYVYKQKGPIREFTDDYIRDKLQAMSSEESWEAMKPLTALGVQLGELGIELDIPEDIAVLDIPAGKIDLQRFFYWHVLKAFHHTELSFDEMNHINFDWYAPANAHRQTVEEVRRWCEESALEIEHEVVQPAGITVIARKAT